MSKNHLRLVVSNKNVKKSLLAKLLEWLSEIKIPGILTYEEKRERVLKYFTLKYADYQLTTGEVGLFPVTEAMNQVNLLEQHNQLEKYYNRNKRRIVG